MTFFAKDINKGLEKAVNDILRSKEGWNLAMSEYLDNRLRRVDLKQSKPIRMSFSYRFALDPTRPELDDNSRYRARRQNADLSDLTLYDQGGVLLTSIVTLRKHTNLPNCDGDGYRLYLLEDGSLAVFSYKEEDHPEEKDGGSQESGGTQYVTASYTAKLERLVLKQNQISATDEWLNEACIDYVDNPDAPYFVLSSEDPSRCIYWFKHEGDGQPREFFIFDKEYLVRGMDAALDSKDDKATVFLNGQYGRDVYVKDGPTPTPEREAQIYMEVDLNRPTLGQPIPQRYVAGEATIDYLIAKLAKHSNVKVLNPSDSGLG